MADAPGLLDCVFVDWSPAIGDPTFLGWFTVGAYGVAAVLVGLVALKDTLGDRALWAFCAVLLLALMVNKQLDLQSFVTALIRCHAHAAGWWEHRRDIQEIFIVVVGAFAVIGLLGILAFAQEGIFRNILLFAGLLTILGFIAIRAAGFHNFDRLIGRDLWILKMNHVLELSAIALFVIAALLRLRTLRRVSRNSSH